MRHTSGPESNSGTVAKITGWPQWGQNGDETHENCPRNTLGASTRKARETVTRTRLYDTSATLLKLAKNKTEQLYLASFPTAPPDIRKGIRIKAS